MFSGLYWASYNSSFLIMQKRIYFIILTGESYHSIIDIAITESHVIVFNLYLSVFSTFNTILSIFIITVQTLYGLYNFDF